MKIAFASDHAGFQLKIQLIEYLKEYDIMDFGTNSEESMDYPDTGFPAAEAVRDHKCEKGILICGTGIGMSIVANKVQGIRASLCSDPQRAELTRLHNNSNILVLAGRFLDYKQAVKIVDAWLKTEFEGGRHQVRLDKISAKEMK